MSELIRSDFLDTADGESARAVEAGHAGTAATEAEEPRERTICGIRPIVAEEANKAERTTAAVAEARHRLELPRFSG